MTCLTITQARADLYRVIDDVCTSHTPALLKGKNNSAILVSEDDWKAMQETPYLLSIPDMHASILKGQKEPLEEMVRVDDLDWG